MREVHVPDDSMSATYATRLAPSHVLGRQPVATAAVVALLLVGLGAFAVVNRAPPQKGDRVASLEVERLTETFRNGHGALVPVDLSTPQKREEILSALRMPAAKARRLMAMVERGERALGWLTLRDNLDEDGDVASVTAAGVTQQVPLFRAPTRIVVPYIPGQPVLVTGEHDGLGGGISVEVELSTGPLPLPPLAVGESVALPLR